MELQAPPTFSLKHQRIFKRNNSAGHAIIKLSHIYNLKKFYYYKIFIRRLYLLLQSPVKKQLKTYIFTLSK